MIGCNELEINLVGQERKHSQPPLHSFVITLLVVCERPYLYIYLQCKVVFVRVCCCCLFFCTSTQIKRSMYYFGGFGPDWPPILLSTTTKMSHE